MKGLLAVVSEKQDAMRRIEVLGDVKSLRYYSYEEEADDMAVRVLAALDMDRDELSKLLLKIEGDAGAQECLSLLSQGQIPSYGVLSDAHHGTCFRIYHMRQVALNPGQAPN